MMQTRRRRNPGHAQNPSEIFYFAQTSLTTPNLSLFCYSQSVLYCVIAECFLPCSACICFGQKITVLSCYNSHPPLLFLCLPSKPCSFSSFSLYPFSVVGSDCLRGRGKKLPTAGGDQHTKSCDGFIT